MFGNWEAFHVGDGGLHGAVGVVAAEQKFVGAGHAVGQHDGGRVVAHGVHVHALEVVRW